MMKRIEFQTFTMEQRKWDRAGEVLVVVHDRVYLRSEERLMPSYVPDYQKLVLPEKVWRVFVELAEMSERSYSAIREHGFKLGSPLEDEARRATSEIITLLRSFERMARVHDV